MRCIKNIILLLCLLQVWHAHVNAQICSCDNYGNELVVNGDFSSGNTGFTSEYEFNTTASPGRYGITTNPHTANFYWPTCPDHTTGTGNMMWVDASSSTSINIWSETINGINPNKDYLFSCWLNTLDATAPAVLQFSVNGVLIGDSLTAPVTTCNWVQFCAIWNSGSNSAATITITNQSLLVYGNDVGIDDISFRECCHHSTTDVAATICDGETYQLPGGAAVSVPGIYSDSFMTSLGCDSVIVTDLSVLSNSFSSQNISICEGESYYAGGAWQSTNGVYVDTLDNAAGCDSVITTHLSVLPLSTFMQDVTICEGQSFLAGGALQTISGIYNDTLSNYLGCDSILTTHLMVLPISYYSQSVSICDGDSFFVGGSFQKMSGTYYDTLISFTGCDSILTTHLTVLLNSTGAQNVSVCDGQSFYAGGAWQTVSGVYVDTLVNFAGCDSVLTTNLTVLFHSAQTQDISICNGQSFYAGGAWQTTGGVYVDTLVNAVGCDSVLTTNLTVLLHSAHAQDVSICNGQSFYAGGAWQTTYGVYLDTLVNAVGCDSVLTTNLTILPNSFFSQPAFICSGDSIFLGGAYQKVAGTYYDTLINFLGCDSVLITQLTVLLHSASVQQVNICDGESFFAGGALQTTSGTYIDTMANMAGCDSVVTTNLMVLPASAYLQHISICGGQAFYCGGAAQTQSGVYVDTLVNFLGCDSVLTTDLSIIPNSSFAQDVAICTGDSVFAGGAWQHQAGIYTDHYFNYLGCDSVLTTNLVLLPVFSTQVNAVICEGESYLAGGSNQSQPGVYVDSLHAMTGCDSIVTTTLEVILKTTTVVYPSICQGEQYLAGGMLQTMPGTYYDTLTSMAGCDSAVITHLTVNPNPVVALGNDTSICTGDTLFIDAGDGYQSYLWQDQSGGRIFPATETGNYRVTVTNVFGCAAYDTLVVVDLYPLPGNFLLSDTVICGNIPVTVSVPGFVKYEWFDGSASAANTFTGEGSYWLKVTDDRGCTGADTISLENACTDDFLMPNAFSPNQDGLNDMFLPIPVRAFTEYDLKIFNRWGMLVFESENLSQGWDGTEQGDNGELGAYVWKMDYTLEDGTRKSASGSVLLLR